MPNVLDKIVASKWREIAQAKSARSESELHRQIRDAPRPRDFEAALGKKAAMHLIAEIKRASPSAGMLRADFNPLAIAAVYSEHGASAISVLTDAPFFQGSLDHLSSVRGVAKVPVLRKDFIVDPYQILESRAHGADAVLLIAELLTDAQLVQYLNLIHELGMKALVELHDRENLSRVVKSGSRVIGINNRNLRTFGTDLAHTIGLAGEVPKDRILVSESGISFRGDVVRLQAAGVRAILVGETLMRSRDIGAKIDELLGHNKH
jgi:indole-3-glycerol phosphate synthase